MIEVTNFILVRSKSHFILNYRCPPFLTHTRSLWVLSVESGNQSVRLGRPWGQACCSGRPRQSSPLSCTVSLAHTHPLLLEEC